MTFFLLIFFGIKLPAHPNYPDNIHICDLDKFKYHEIIHWDQNTKQDPKNKSTFYTTDYLHGTQNFLEANGSTPRYNKFSACYGTQILSSELCSQTSCVLSSE